VPKSVWPFTCPLARLLSSSPALEGGKLKAVAEADIQYVSSESGEPIAVIVPISLWRDIESERETAYLLKSESMRRRLLEAKERQQGLSLDETIAKLGI
jgi:antitoxin YefM